MIGYLTETTTCVVAKPLVKKKTSSRVKYKIRYKSFSPAVQSKHSLNRFSLAVHNKLPVWPLYSLDQHEPIHPEI